MKGVSYLDNMNCFMNYFVFAVKLKGKLNAGMFGASNHNVMANGHCKFNSLMEPMR